MEPVMRAGRTSPPAWRVTLRCSTCGLKRYVFVTGRGEDEGAVSDDVMLALGAGWKAAHDGHRQIVVVSPARLRVTDLDPDSDDPEVEPTLGQIADAWRLGMRPTDGSTVEDDPPQPVPEGSRAMSSGYDETDYEHYPTEGEPAGGETVGHDVPTEGSPLQGDPDEGDGLGEDRPLPGTTPTPAEYPPGSTPVEPVGPLTAPDESTDDTDG